MIKSESLSHKRRKRTWHEFDFREKERLFLNKVSTNQSEKVRDKQDMMETGIRRRHALSGQNPIKMVP